LIGVVFAGIGAALVVIGTIGIHRFRDVYARLQASGVSDNAGLTLVLAGLMLYGGWASADWALLLLALLLLATNPIATHSIAKSAFVQRHKGEDER
jgi:multicomponent Na+:H+ antiporter subunit G